MNNTTSLTIAATALLACVSVTVISASDDLDRSHIKDSLTFSREVTSGMPTRGSLPDIWGARYPTRLLMPAMRKGSALTSETAVVRGEQFAQAESKSAGDQTKDNQSGEQTGKSASRADVEAARTRGRGLLMAASEKLKSYASVRANISEKVSIQGHSFTAKGSYLQGQNLRLRMEFAVELGGQKSSLLEICDGQILWSRHDLGAKDQTQITRRDVRQILQAAQQAEQRMTNADDKTRFQATLTADLGLGGLPALLAAFSRDYDFSAQTAEKIDDREMIVIEGTWNSKYLEGWLGTKSKEKKGATLPPHVPDLVRISLDAETQFPRRVEYLKNPTTGGPRTPLMVVDFTKVVFNGRVSNDDFVFIAPERPAPLDITQYYLQRLAPPRKESKKAASEAPPEAP